MKSINRITYFENKNRLELLENYKNSVRLYFSNIQKVGPYGMDGYHENEQAKTARTYLNTKLDQVKRIVLSSGQDFQVKYKQAPMLGGQVFHLDLLDNLFKIPEMDFDESHIIDVLDRSIGEYENNKKTALLKTINPFFWVFQFIEFIVSLPFKLIGQVGFDQEKAEESTIGKVFKIIFYLVSTLASVLAILDILGLTNFVKNLLNIE